jgi:hypothetical protein
MAVTPTRSFGKKETYKFGSSQSVFSGQGIGMSDPTKRNGTGRRNNFALLMSSGGNNDIDPWNEPFIGPQKFDKILDKVQTYSLIEDGTKLSP